MQITSSTQTGAAAPASPSRPAVDNAKPNDSTQSPPPSSAKVTISNEAKKKHYETKDSASESADPASDQPQLSRNKSAVPSGETEKPSPVKSLVYGALNLPPPEEAAKNPDKAYSAGKWLGAVGTVIGVATLLLRFI
jgi:hypothetical protein